MKSFYKLIILTGFVHALVVGCKKADTNEDLSPPSIGCRVATTSDAGSATYTYRSDGQIDRIQYASGDKIENTYNARGFITTQKYIAANGSVSSTNSYEFVNDRIARYTIAYAVSNVSTTQTFDYDGNGELKQTVYSVTGNTPYTETITYTNGKQVGYVFRNAAGQESQIYTFENGHIKSNVSDVSGKTVTNYEYDAQGRRTRDESLLSGQVNFYTVYEYTDGKAVQQAIPPLKGFPTDWRQGVNKGNYGLITKVTDYNMSSSGSMYISHEATYTYSKNTSGFPLEQKFTDKQYNTKGEVTGSGNGSSSYTYLDCP